MTDNVESFTFEEKVYAVAWSLSHNNREESRRLFQQKYCKEPPTANHIKFWSLKLLETGTLVQRRSSSGRPSTASSEENKEKTVLLKFRIEATRTSLSITQQISLIQ